MKGRLWHNPSPLVAVMAPVALALASLGAGVAGAEGKPDYGCGAGFDYHLTTTAASELPKSQRAIDAGFITKEDLIAAYRASFDHNGNDMVCVKDPPGWQKNAQLSLVDYLYQFADDASSSPNGP